MMENTSKGGVKLGEIVDGHQLPRLGYEAHLKYGTWDEKLGERGLSGDGTEETARSR